MENWKKAKTELRRAGIIVRTSESGCCLGCEDRGIAADSPYLIQLRKRFSNEFGGYLCHGNIADTPLADAVIEILNRYEITYEWDKSEWRAIGITL